MDITNDNACPASWNTYLGNYRNKEKAFSTYLRNSFRIVKSPSDASITIVKVGIHEAGRFSVTVYCDDRDILCTLAHHVSRNEIQI